MLLPRADRPYAEAERPVGDGDALVVRATRVGDAVPYPTDRAADTFRAVATAISRRSIGALATATRLSLSGPITVTGAADCPVYETVKLLGNHGTKRVCGRRFYRSYWLKSSCVVKGNE